MMTNGHAAAPLRSGARLRQTRAHDPDATRQDLLAAAQVEFAEHGFDRAHLDQIARRAAANKRLIYAYFGNKADLYWCVLSDAYRALQARLDALSFDALPPAEAVRQLVECAFDFCERSPLSRLLALRDATTAGPVPPIELDAVLIVARLRELLESGARCGAFRAGVDARQLAGTIFALCSTGGTDPALLSFAFGMPVECSQLRSRRAHVVELVLAYLRPDRDVRSLRAAPARSRGRSSPRPQPDR